MSQLNLKQVLSGDDLSIVVDKLNYNFNQILLNGGGPQGLKGIIGAPGIPGAQGLQGLTGPIGDEGTHIYVDGVTPGDYPFGTGGEILPRTGDIFIETNTIYLQLWQYMLTGTSTNFWDEVERITAPQNAISKLVYDQVYGTGSSSSWTSSANDPAIAGKFLFGSAEALYGNFVIDPANPITSANPYVRVELSSPSLYGDSIVTYAGIKNQLRILDSGRPDDYTRVQTGGGIVHSVQTTAGKQVYRIMHGDYQGNNYFTLKLNSSGSITGALLHGDNFHRLGVGVNEFVTLTARLTADSTLAIGKLSTGFYGVGATFYNGIGAIIEGNLAIGRNRNLYATGGFYNLPSSYGASVLIDTTRSAASRDAVSELYFGGDMYDAQVGGTTSYNYWKFKHDSYTSPGNPNYRKFTLFTRQADSGFGTYTQRTVLTAGLTAGFGYNNCQISVDSLDLYDKFEVGDLNYNRVSIGNQQGVTASGHMNMHLGFNLSRSPIESAWRRMGDGTYNTGKGIWTSPIHGLGVSMFASTSGVDVTNITDEDVFSNTRLYIGLSGNLVLSESSNATSVFLQSEFPLHVNFGAIRSSGQGTDYNTWRRFIATFGDGAYTGKDGSPVIATTNGVTQSISTGITAGTGVTASVVPHYTWYGSELYGLYLSQGTTVNGASGKAVGLAVGGTAGLTLVGDYLTEGRMGIFQENPLSRLQIGEKITVHDGSSSKFIGYNLYYNSSAAANRRILSGSPSPGTIYQGAFEISYLENNRADGTIGLTRFANLGTKLALVPYSIGILSEDLATPVNGSTYRGMIISPPSTFPTGVVGWSNLSSNVPQIAIGLDSSTYSSEQDSSTSLRRGTLSLAAQMRIKPASAATPSTGPFGLTIEDQYNLGLYSYDGYPVSAIYSTGSSSSASKSFGINFIGTGGNAIVQDISLLYATTNRGLDTPYSRIANFGASFRLGVNYVPQTQTRAYTLSTDPIHDLASLVIGGYSEGLPSTYEKAIISKGILVVDQSIYSMGDGGNQGILFKDNSILAHGATSRSSINDYFGDWGIQYWRVNSGEAGLNFWKPSDSIGTAAGDSNILYLSDNGQVGVGTTSFIYTPLSQILGPAVAVKFAVDGKIACDTLIETSDARLKANVEEMTSSLEKILNLRPVLFSWKNENDLSGGFIAQDVANIIPEAVKIFPDVELEGGRYSLHYDTILATAVGALQDQQKIIVDQEQKIKKLEERLSIIEKLLNI